MDVERSQPKDESAEAEHNRELEAILKEAPLVLDMMTPERVDELLTHYMRGVKAGTHGDDLLRSMARERNFEKICATALKKILTRRIDENPANTVSRKNIRNHLNPLLEAIIRKHFRAKRRID